MACDLLRDPAPPRDCVPASAQPPRRAPRLSIRVALMILAVAAGIASVAAPWWSAPAAHADNQLVSSNPADGASVESSPTSITLTFAQPVGAKNTVVATCNGTQVPIGNPTVSPDALTLTVAVVNLFPKGECNVTYVVSAPDDSPNGSATIGFTVANDPPAGAVTTAATTTASTAPGATTIPGGTTAGSTAGTTAGTTTGTTPSTAAADGSSGTAAPGPKVGGPLGMARWFTSLGLAALLGSLVLIVTGWPEGIEYILTVRFLRLTWIVSVLGAVATVVFMTSQLTGRSVGSALNPTSWADLKDTTPGIAAIVRLVATLGAGWAIVRPERVIEPGTQLPALAGPVVAVATYGFSRTGGDLAVIGAAAGIVHGLAMAVWVGGLALLTRVVLAGPGDEDLVHAVRGYQRLSGPALVLTVLSGAVQTYRLDGGSLFDTGHGRAVLFKALLVGGMVFVGLVTRQFVNGALRRTDVMTAPLAARLRRATGIEALGGVVVLALSAWLLALSPAGLSTDSSDTTRYGSVTTVTANDLSVTVSITGVVGENGVRVEVTQPATGLTSLVIKFIPPEGTAAPEVDLTVPAQLTGAGVAVLPESEGVPLVVAGTWTMQVDAVTPAGAQTASRNFFLVS